MSRKRLLIVSPHFSTGGAPQVTLNKVRLLKDHFDILVVEHSFLAWNYVVQRNKIIDIVGKNFLSLGDNKRELLDFIDSFNPDVISMEEFPEMFLENDIAREIYSDSRPYRIVESTHDSSFNPDHKRWMPDEFVFVSAYNIFKYAHLDIPMRVIEYPVDEAGRDRHARDFKHVIIVGLWTQRKNQGYAIEMARHLVDYNVKFHFLGNQAGNFEEYWKPLMEDLPENCIVHGESNIINQWVYEADMFLFPSRGDRGNKELNPIAIKEALCYPDLPKMMYNLDVYCNKYNDYDDVVYLTGDSYTDSMNMRDILNLQEKNKELVVIGTYPDTKAREDLTIACINSAKELGRPIMLVSHYPVNWQVQEMVDYYVYDKHNPLTHHSYYNRFTRSAEDYSVEMRIEGPTNQSLTVLTNLINAGKSARDFGYTKMFYVTFDHVIDEKDYGVINQSFNMLGDTWKAVLATLDTPFGKGIQTNGMFFKTDFVGKLLDDVRTPEEYNTLCESIGAQNFLEDYMMKKVQNTQGVWVEYPKEQTLLVHTGEGKSSNSEYVGIVKNEKWDIKYFYFYSYNESIPYYYIKQYNKDGNLLYTEDFAKKEKYTPLVYDTHRVELVQVENDYIRTYYVDDIIGSINIKDTPVEIERPKIKLVHIQTTLNDDREQASRASLERVRDYGWEYILHTNHPYKDLPPRSNCARPDCVSMELFDPETVARLGTALTPAHYGCYEAFKNAILSEFDDCDYLIVCEGDCIIEIDINKFVYMVESCAVKLEENNIGFMSFGDKDTLEFGWPQSPVVKEVNDDMYITDHLIGMQCIMFPKYAKSYLKEKLRTHPWDAADMYFNNIFYGSGYNMGIVHNRMTTQADGYSLIDKQFKTFRK